jgi:hypothetical protein
LSLAVSAGWEMNSASAARLTLCRLAVSTKAVIWLKRIYRFY